MAPVRVTVSPAHGTRHTQFRLSMITRRATGVFGTSRSSYRADLRAVDPASACVKNRDRAFPTRPAGVRAAMNLGPLGGEGGHLGWCGGRFAGTVTYYVGFACPAKGTCIPPAGFPRRADTVARFTVEIQR